MKVYVAGPMRGQPYFNFPLFDSVTKYLRDKGYEVVNPAEHDRAKWPAMVTWPGFTTGDPADCPGLDLQLCLKWDFQNLMLCDAIVMLPGWERSSGACDERRIAERTGLRTFHAYLNQEGKDPIIVEVDPDRMGTPTVQEV